MFNSKKIINKFNKEIKKIKNNKHVIELYIKYLSKKGKITNLIKLIKNIPKNLKPKFGKKINNIKNYIKKKINFFKKQYKYSKKNKYIDLSLSGRYFFIKGNIHPITKIINKIENFFYKLGFKNIQGNEIEDIYHNFHALNINKYHPSRSKKDTFWINNKKLLRTQTSCMQIRCLKYIKPPVKIITSGCVFRKDYDHTHTPMFHQLECFIIEKNINLTNLKYIINEFINYFFRKKIQKKFLPAYFPFTEPSLEIYIKSKNKKWLEILGCGLIHPKILKNSKINPKEYSGLALGMGIERLLMIKYNISDIRLLYNNNIEFLDQF